MLELEAHEQRDRAERAADAALDIVAHARRSRAERPQRRELRERTHRAKADHLDQGRTSDLDV